MNRIKKLLVIGCAFLLVSECGNGVANENTKSKQNSGEKKTVLTAEEAASLFANEVGRWRVTGKNMPVGGDVEPFEDMMETRWVVKGKSIELTFSPLINGRRVAFVTQREYDPKEGVFTCRTKGEGFPETSGRDHYDPATKTYQGTYIHSDGVKETKKCVLVSKEQMRYESQFELDGKVVFSREAFFARLVDNKAGEKKW